MPETGKWPACSTYPALGCVCRGGLAPSTSTCTRKRTGDLRPVGSPGLDHERLLADAIVRIALACGVEQRTLPIAMTGPQILDLAEQTEFFLNGLFKSSAEAAAYRTGVPAAMLERAPLMCGHELEPGVLCDGTAADPNSHGDQCPHYEGGAAYPDRRPADAHAPALYSPHSPWMSHV